MEAPMAAQAPPPPSKELAHPPYTEMIASAIKALNEKTGSSKIAIAKFIDSTYTSLPQNNSVLLARHLKRLKTKGIVSMIKHSYKLSSTSTTGGSDGVEKRGRGRPPKSAAVSGGSGVLMQKRGRGRPPKVAKPKPVGTGLVKRGRGRPPLKPKPVGVELVKRGRGRPALKKPKIVDTGLVKRGRGRPALEKPKSVGAELVKRGRGRPSSKPKPEPSTTAAPSADPAETPSALVVLAETPSVVVVPATVARRGRPAKVKKNSSPSPTLITVPGVLIEVEAEAVKPKIVSPTGRPRGRPAKAEGAKPKVGSSTGKPRGRPKKAASTPTPVPVVE